VVLEGCRLLSILLLLLQRELCRGLRQGALLLWADQRDLTAETNRKQILSLLKCSAEGDERKGNSSLGFTYCPTSGDEITHSFPVERAEVNIRCPDPVLHPWSGCVTPASIVLWLVLCSSDNRSPGRETEQQKAAWAGSRALCVQQ